MISENIDYIVNLQILKICMACMQVAVLRCSVMLFFTVLNSVLGGHVTIRNKT